MTNTKIFAYTFLMTTSAVLLVLFIKRAPKPPELQKISNSVFISTQLKPENFRLLMRNRINTMVDLRPDGEASDEPTHTEMEAAAYLNGIRFYYIPIPHESIPAAAVDALAIALHDELPNTVLYCRTGRRAARTFALFQASQPSGPLAEDILSSVQRAGFSAEDLRDEINQRIALRVHAQESKK